MTEENDTTKNYAIKLQQSMKKARDLINQQQAQVREEDDEELLRFENGYLVLLQNQRLRKGESYSPSFVGPFSLLETFGNHTSKVDNQR